MRSLQGLVRASVLACVAACTRAPPSTTQRAPSVSHDASPSVSHDASVAPAVRPDPLAPAALRATVEALASPAMEGRAPGTPGDVAARALIESAMRRMGLAAPPGGYQQPFTFVPDDEDEDEDEDDDDDDDDGAPVRTANVAGVLRGGDARRAGEIVVVGAHHDHLGREGGEVFPGANDNATGVAVVLAVAGALAQRTEALPRTVVFVTFGAEEEGLHGSAAWVRAPPAGLAMAQTLFMLNVDMVGSYASDGCLYALHTFRGTPGRLALDALAPAYPDLRIARGERGDESDHVNFCAAGVPTTFFYTPEPRCYHRPCDTAARIEWASLSRIAHLARDLVATVAAADDLAARRAAGCRPRRARAP